MKKSFCEKVTNTKVQLNHFKHNHNNRGELNQCNVCTKPFQTQKGLVLHMKSVHGGKNYKCESCEK